MKKGLIVLMLMFLGASMSLVKVNADSSIKHKITQFVQEYSAVESTWKDVKIKSPEKLYDIDDELIGWIFRVFQKNIQQGYVVYILDEGIIEAKFTGEDRAVDISGKVYYITPSGFFSKKQVKEHYEVLLANAAIEIEKVTSGEGRLINYINYDSSGHSTTYGYTDMTFYINTSHVPDLSSNVDSYSASSVSKVWIENVPSYLDDYTPVVNSCSAIAGAMLIAYYDNELWNNLSTHEGIWWWQSFPLFHEDDEAPVDDLILELSEYYHTCIDMDGDLDDTDNCIGSSAEEIAYGNTEYFSDHNHSSYETLRASMADYDDDFSALILLGNPAVLTLSSSSTYGSHAVIGIGFYNVYMNPSGIVIYDDFDHGEVWINRSLVVFYEFIYND
ncbi:hypothetical protein RJI07_07190 [Mycoplasmatota bacterium WC30]